jgi:chemosensory pili system protein ChpA (sensor histidine kinase/response regulator)
MVGLMDLGEVAWEIEQVMNKWLEQQRPATPALLALVETASAVFAGWLAQLRDGGLPGEIDGAQIVSRARELKSEAPQEDLAAAAPAAPESAPAPAPEPARGHEPEALVASDGGPLFDLRPAPEPQPAPELEEVEIGGLRLARSFFEI